MDAIIRHSFHQCPAKRLLLQRPEFLPRETIQRIHGADNGTLIYRNNMPDWPHWYDSGLPHLWLPVQPDEDGEPAAAVAATEGVRIRLADGRELIDGIASWWTACHGYNHPHIRAAVERQLAQMPHVMFGGLVHEQAAMLAQRLCALLPGQFERAFFSDSGSVAVEIAMKMAVQFWLNRGIKGRAKFVSFKGGYHGDTTGAMSVCDPDEGMHAMFAGMLPQQHVIDLPRDEESIARFERLLERHAGEIACIIVEPLVQGAGGMIFHDAEVLRRLRDAAHRYDLLLIFDEIFTGFGRTGRMFACEEAGVMPDIICLSKALTGGTLPLAATIATKNIFDAFWSDRPHARADARANLYGERAGLRRGQRLARSVRARAAAATSRRHFCAAGARAGTGPRNPRRLERARARRHRRCGTRADRRPERTQARLCRRGRVDSPIPQHCLSDTGVHNRHRRSYDSKRPPLFV